VKFSQLRLSGFKSFVEPTELLIKDGLTGIVGPNGCGKSNLVEALRWVMGETSAKNMRGGAMDDVIFAGTTSRPARNVAEVTLGLDNKDRAAPPAYNETEELDVTRRIRRDSGSDYRINGKITRARDVQLLFADMATGASSTAIVSQGRVGSLINAKPKDRRHLLEEAAGISGLHSRRHEAELRLRAAETNLERVDDVTGQLEVQLGSLKRQARQANRYRNISGHIRHAEALLYIRKYERAAEAQKNAQLKFNEASYAVTELTRQVAIAQNASLKAGEALKPLREKEAIAVGNIHRLTLGLENLTAEEERLKKARKQLEDRKHQITSDMQRERNLEKDAADAIIRLDQEHKTLSELTEISEPKITKRRADIEKRQQDIRSLQQQMDGQTEQLAMKKAAQNGLIQQRNNLVSSLTRLQHRAQEIDKEKLILKGQLESLDGTDTVSAELKSEIAKLAAFNTQLEETDVKRQTADKAERQARDQIREAEKELSASLAEVKTLKSMLDRGLDGNGSPVAESLKVKKGFEIALGAALGDDLEAPTDDQATTYWSLVEEHGPAPGFAKGTKTLDQFVSGEEALAYRLSQVAVAENDAEAEQLARQLVGGQRVVSKVGDLWRWDGFCQKSGAKTAAALRLEQRNRLSDVELQATDQQVAVVAIKETVQKTERALADIKGQEQQIRHARRDAEKTRGTLQAKQADHQRALTTKRSRLEALGESSTAQQTEITDAEQKLRSIKAEMADFPDLTEKQIALDKQRNKLRESRDHLASIRAETDKLIRDAAVRADRLHSISTERENWVKRSTNMADHFNQLEIRFSSTEDDLKSLKNKPEQLVQKRCELMDEMARAEGARSSIRDHVAEAEAVQKQCDDALKQVQEALATCREERVRHDADVEHTAQIINELSGQVLEKLGCAPDKIRQNCDIEETEDIPDIATSERKVERLKKERDGMGPVNLRAELEAQEVDEQLTTLLDERADLEAAIARLRQGIGSLNKEGRERLLKAFVEVDRHFQKLFKDVFGGGYAHLKLTESDDPLAAGLEIMASPPGKRLQLMSLLSGGEQALTAVALLFAVFLTNPAPICVLDEVDAPLDDVNVDRLCNLLDKISADSSTRFLVVTHHPITMARMDRLFGVTMAERGISQLVSVDLTRAQLMTNETV
jgi:chromosome segregation protein